MKSVAWMGATLTIALWGCENTRDQPTYGTDQTETRRSDQDSARTPENTGTTGETGAYGTGETQAEPQGGVAGDTGTQPQTGGQAMQGDQGACQQLSTCYQVLQRSLCGSDDTACRSQFEVANIPMDESACRTQMSQVRERVQPYMAAKSDFSMPTECSSGQ